MHESDLAFASDGIDQPQYRPRLNGHVAPQFTDYQKIGSHTRSIEGEAMFDDIDFERTIELGERSFGYLIAYGTTAAVALA